MPRRREAGAGEISWKLWGHRQGWENSYWKDEQRGKRIQGQVLGPFITGMRKGGGFRKGGQIADSGVGDMHVMWTS